jgi:hypothetical protein
MAGILRREKPGAVHGFRNLRGSETLPSLIFFSLTLKSFIKNESS